jgi:hypothetical protein
MRSVSDDEKDSLERAETLAAIRTGMEEFKRGESIPLDKADERLRKKHGFPDKRDWGSRAV